MYYWIVFLSSQKMGMTEDDKRNCCLVEIQETEAKYYKTLEDIEKVKTSTFPSSVLLCKSQRPVSQVAAGKCQLLAHELWSTNVTEGDQCGYYWASASGDWDPWGFKSRHHHIALGN